jgi:hypothetical protein
VETIDSNEELKEAVDDPEALLERVSHQSGPAAKKAMGDEGEPKEKAKKEAEKAKKETEAEEEKTKKEAEAEKAKAKKEAEAKKEVEAKKEEWQILSELKANTGFANWSKNTDGWDTLEEHHDPGKCAGVTTSLGKITWIDLNNSNLMGGESHAHTQSRTTMRRLTLFVSCSQSCPSRSGASRRWRDCSFTTTRRSKSCRRRSARCRS